MLPILAASLPFLPVVLVLVVAVLALSRAGVEDVHRPKPKDVQLEEERQAADVAAKKCAEHKALVESCKAGPIDLEAARQVFAARLCGHPLRQADHDSASSISAEAQIAATAGRVFAKVTGSEKRAKSDPAE